ncbi:MAG: CxxC-x17-CxxC domain-containing protein [Candidatus Omnitrophota bacterium]|nr:hypothetical protein [Candidatus Omnitrophota bacterium]
MKKQSKHKSYSPPQDKPDITEMLAKIQQQLVFLEKKIDSLINKPAAKPFNAEHAPRPFQHFGNSQRPSDANRDTNFRERTLHKAVCADCGKGCEVPFKPSGDRPVYCKECFSKRKTGGPFKSHRDEMPRHQDNLRVSDFGKSRHEESRHTGAKKKAGSKKRKK